MPGAERKRLFVDRDTGQREADAVAAESREENKADPENDPFTIMHDWLEAKGLLYEFMNCELDRMDEIIEQYAKEGEAQ